MKVIVVSGPTASGKTNISIELALKFNAEIVNFDSLLLYKEITIGTAKPTLLEQQNIPHHMLNVRSISDPMNAADYAREALPIINSLLQKKKNVILVGGSGFYLQALIKGMYVSSTTPSEISKKSDDLYKNQGITPFLDFLKTHDIKSFERYHENDHYRIRRAVEHFWSHATALSLVREEKDQSNLKSEENNIHGWDLCHIYLDLPKEEHLSIITERTQKMLEAGLYEEVLGLLKLGFTGEERPLQSIGYKEMLDYNKKIYKTIDECKERIIISTRQLAKSQKTWFKRDQSKKKFHPLQQKELLFAEVSRFLGLL